MLGTDYTAYGIAQLYYAKYYTYNTIILCKYTTPIPRSYYTNIPHRYHDHTRQIYYTYNPIIRLVGQNNLKSRIHQYLIYSSIPFDLSCFCPCSAACSSSASVMRFTNSLSSHAHASVSEGSN